MHFIKWFCMHGASWWIDAPSAIGSAVMSTPFREDALALAGTDAKPLIAKWDAERIPFDLQIALLFLGGGIYSAVRGGGPPTALVGVAANLGFQYVGRFRFAGLIPFFGPVREAWTDRDAIVRISFRRALPRGPIEASMGPYLLTTTFDDGTAITTWSRRVELPPSSLVQNRFGTGDLAADYQSHRAAIAEHTSETCRPLRIPDLATALALATHYDRRFSPWAITMLARVRGTMLVVLMLVIGVVVQLVRR